MASIANTRRRLSPRPRALLATLLVMLVVSPAAGEAPPPILHEYIPPPEEMRHLSWIPKGGLAPQIHAGDQLLPRPILSTTTASSPPPQSPTVSMDRQTKLSPDRRTIHDGVLHYHAIFNPSIVPFKRLVAYDAVDTHFKLQIHDRHLTPIPLRRRPTPPTHDAFWGDLRLLLHPNIPSPIPSVAPNATLIAYETQPPVRLRFFRDSAGNYWVRGQHAGPLHLILHTDAPRRFFTPTIPVEVTIAQVPRALRPHLPTPLREAARRVIVHIGIRSPRLHDQLDRLVAYFRNFSPGPLPRRYDNTYLDIALSQRGVCRHRSYAFTITAQALGIPTRYVTNEAHAFVEVFVPHQGWARIDLGGASTRLDINDAQTKVLHTPAPDPFPRPSAYTRGYSQLRGPIQGLPPTPKTRRARRVPSNRSLNRFRRQPAASGTMGASLSDGSRGASSGRATPRDDRRSARGSMQAPAPQQDTPDLSPPITPDHPTPPPKESTTITVYSSSHSVLRGKSLLAWGSVQVGARGVSGLRVEIYLSHNGSRGRILGATQTRARGAYKVRLLVPRSVAVGHYRLYAATPGDATYAPSLSR